MPLPIPLGEDSCGPRSQPASLAPGQSEATLASGQPPLRAPASPSCPQVYASSRRLRIGYYESDNLTQPSPSMTRAVRLTSKLLQDAGHQVGLLSP